MANFVIQTFCLNPLVPLLPFELLVLNSGPNLFLFSTLKQVQTQTLTPTNYNLCGTEDLPKVCSTEGLTVDCL